MRIFQLPLVVPLILMLAVAGTVRANSYDPLAVDSSFSAMRGSFQSVEKEP